MKRTRRSLWSQAGGDERGSFIGGGGFSLKLKSHSLYTFKKIKDGRIKSCSCSHSVHLLLVRIRFPVLPLPLVTLSIIFSLLLSLRVPISPPVVFPVRLLVSSLLVARSVFLSISLLFTFSLFLLVGFAEAAWQTERPLKTKQAQLSSNLLISNSNYMTSQTVL